MVFPAQASAPVHTPARLTRFSFHTFSYSSQFLRIRAFTLPPATRTFVSNRMPPPKKAEKKAKSPGLFASMFSSPKPSKPVSGDVVKSSSSSKSSTSSSSKASSSSKGVPKAPPPPSSKAAAPAPPAPSAAPAGLAAPSSNNTGAPRPPSSRSHAEPAEAPRPAIRKEDAVAAWQARPRVPSRMLPTYVNFMVLGESGLGKTTFISNLVSSFKVANVAKVQDGSATTLSQFQADPDSLRTVLESMDIPESSRKLMISIQDMPGWGDDINLMRYLRIITSFLLEQRAKDYEKLAGSRNLGETAMCGQLQHSITACLYFLPPHRVKKIDLILMAAISQLVTVVPVISKADTMTEAELNTYRGEVLAMLQQPGKFVGARNLPPLEVNLFKFASDVLKELGTSNKNLPVAVVCSRENEPLPDPAFLSSLGLSPEEMGGEAKQPVRSYGWGSCYPLNRGHSDLILLKRLLLGDQVESLYSMLDDSYTRYVQFCESYEENGKQLQMVVQDACQIGGPHLEYDDYAKAKVALDSAKAAMSTLSEENRALTERLTAVEKEKRQLLERLRGTM